MCSRASERGARLLGELRPDLVSQLADCVLADVAKMPVQKTSSSFQVPCRGITAGQVLCPAAEDLFHRRHELNVIDVGEVVIVSRSLFREVARSVNKQLASRLLVCIIVLLVVLGSTDITA